MWFGKHVIEIWYRFDANMWFDKVYTLFNMSSSSSNSEDERSLIEYYFARGFQYDSIVDFLSKRHGISMSERTLRSSLNAYGSLSAPASTSQGPPNFPPTSSCCLVPSSMPLNLVDLPLNVVWKQISPVWNKISPVWNKISAWKQISPGWN